MRAVFSRVMWVGRATVFLVGLAVILALLFGVASTALGKNGNPFILGKAKNTASKVTGLIGKVATGSALVVQNPSGGSALDLSVGDPLADPATKTVAPMKVNSQAKVANLNADRIDDREASSFANATHAHAGQDITSGLVAEGRIDGSIARDTEIMQRVTQQDGSGSTLDADKLDNLDSTAFGIKTEHNMQQSSDCDTPNVNNNCAPVRVVVPPGKAYHVSIWSSMSWTGASTTQDMEYCVNRIAVGGGAQGSFCVTPFNILNRITLPANQRVAASVSGETTLGPGTWDLATMVAPLASEVAGSDRNWIITKVMVRDASAPAPPIN